MIQAFRIFTAFRTHDIYPKAGHEFTAFEAFVDLALDAYPKGIVTRSLGDMARAWSWPKTTVDRFLKSLAQQKLVQRSPNSGQWSLVKAEKWYDLPVEKETGAQLNARLVIEVFNETFKRKIVANDYRIRTIASRITESRKQVALTLDDFRKLFRYKLKEWGEDPEMKKYLTIETLCARKHFQKYLEQSREVKASEGQRLQGSIMQAR